MGLPHGGGRSFTIRITDSGEVRRLPRTRAYIKHASVFEAPEHSLGTPDAFLR
jgi:hypothetical protein